VELRRSESRKDWCRQWVAVAAPTAGGGRHVGERPIARANAAVGLPPLYPASESRRQKVLAILNRDGGHYATLVEDPNTDPVVMAVATLDGTCDLQIPGDRYDPFAILAMVVG